VKKVIYIIFILFVWLIFNPVIYGQSNVPTENQLKSVYLYNFTNFVKWPKNTFYDSNTPFIIGVLGDCKFIDELKEIVKGEKVDKTHPIQIKVLQNSDEADICQIVYTTYDDKNSLLKLFALLKEQSILIVGDSKNFAKLGGTIEFVNVDKKVLFDINITVAESAGLTISSRLQRVARKIVK